MSAGATKTLYRGVATSQIGPSEAGRKRAIKGNNSEGGHIVPRLPWDAAAASCATRAIMNGRNSVTLSERYEFSRATSRRGNEIFIGQLIQMAVPSFF